MAGLPEMKYACSEGDKMQRVLAVCITLLLVSCSEPLFVVEGKIDTYEWINPKNIGVSFVAQEDLDSNFASSLPYVSASPNNSFHVEIPSNYAYLSKIYLIYDQFELSYDIDVAVDSYLSKGITLLDIGTFPFYNKIKMSLQKDNFEEWYLSLVCDEPSITHYVIQTLELLDEGYNIIHEIRTTDVSLLNLDDLITIDNTLIIDDGIYFLRSFGFTDSNYSDSRGLISENIELHVSDGVIESFRKY